MIRDKSYDTVRFGEVASFDGAFVFERHGRPLLEAGLGPVGGPDWVGQQGRIETTPLDRGEVVDVIITVNTLDGKAYYTAELQIRGQTHEASPYQRFATEDDAVNAAISPAARKLVFLRRLYVVPGYAATEPAPSWAGAVMRTLADPTSAEWYAKGWSVRAACDAVS